MKRKIRTGILRLTLKISALIDMIRDFVNIVVGLLTIVAFIFAFFIIWAYSSLLLKNYDNAILRTVCQVIFAFSRQPHVISAEFIRLNYNTIKSSLEYCINISVAVSSLLLSVIAFFSFVQKRRDLNKSIGIKKYTLSSNNDRQDLAIMNEYYRDADTVIIFSTSFRWLYDEEQKYIRNTLEDIDNAKLIITGEGKDELINKLKEIGSTLEKSVVPKQLHSAKRFSFVKRRGNTRCVLYRQDVSETPYIIAISENINNTLLLDAFESIIVDFTN